MKVCNLQSKGNTETEGRAEGRGTCGKKLKKMTTQCSEQDIHGKKIVVLHGSINCATQKQSPKAASQPEP